MSRHQGQEALLDFIGGFPVLRAALGGADPTTMYSYNRALTWRVGSIEVTVYDRRVSVNVVDGAVHHASVAVMEPGWKMPQQLFDHMAGAVVHALLTDDWAWKS